MFVLILTGRTWPILRQYFREYIIKNIIKIIISEQNSNFSSFLKIFAYIIDSPANDSRSIIRSKISSVIRFINSCSINNTKPIWFFSIRDYPFCIIFSHVRAPTSMTRSFPSVDIFLVLRPATNESAPDRARMNNQARANRVTSGSEHSEKRDQIRL